MRIERIETVRHEDFPNLLEFPLQDVINALKYDYFNNSP